MTPHDRLASLSVLACRAQAEIGTSVVHASRVVADALREGGAVYVCGNGGSMAQALHFAAELTGRYRLERGPLACVALGADPAHATCVANDYDAELVFARQLEALADAGDVLLCLTTSGRSPNVRAAADVAKRLGLPVVAVTGNGYESHWWRACSAHVSIPTADTALVQELTLSVLHSICEHVDEVFGGES